MYLHPRLRLREVSTFSNEARTLSLAARLEKGPIEAIRERQGRLLRWIVDYAYRYVPFYRSSFDRAGVSPSSIRTVDDAARLPVLTKREVVDNFPGAILARDFSQSNTFRSASSGTSGVRGTFLCDWPTRDANFALLFRARALFGYRPGDVECCFTWWPDRKDRWFQRIGFQRRIRISILDPPSGAVERLLDERPGCIFGTPSYLYMVSTLANPGRLREISPKLVLATGELMDRGMRASIEEAFGAPVVDLYGSAEHNFISSECPGEGNHHVNMLNCLLETTRDGVDTSPGEAGEILVTTLTNRAMPLIRYRTGDSGSISDEECPCGRRGDILESLLGRCDDFLKARSGMNVPAEILRRIVTGRLRGYRIVQESMGRFRICHTHDGLSEETRKAIAGEFRRVMGDPGLEVEFEAVEEIKPDPSGKRRLVVCRV